ncbi:MAG: alpha-L-fucosidase, partial [Sarcina sp.]
MFNGAAVSTDNYVINQGGPSKGYSIVTVSIPYYGTYNLVLTRKNSTIRPLNIDINGVNTGTTYYVPAGIGMKYIVYNIVFNTGTNTIKFYGDSSDSYTPDLLTVNVLYTSASLPKNTSATYDVTSATLMNGATISEGFSISNGGVNNGYTLFNVKIISSGVYNLSLYYRHTTTNGRPMNIDVNNVNTGTIYMVPPATPGTFKIKVNLELGMNTIKIYGDGKGNYTPDIKSLNLDLITPVPVPPDKYLTVNPSSLPNIYTLRNIDLKYGMFLHFSINTFVDLEWSDGTIDPIKFEPQHYDVDKWVELIWEAGMNYIILITKHHDGMSLKDSVYSDYDIAASSTTFFNLIKAVADSCKKYGIKLALYYSLWDRNWDNRYGVTNTEVYADYMINQLVDLLDGTYG